jgi:hypothetical protein
MPVHARQNNSRESLQCVGMDPKAKTLTLSASKDSSSSRVVKDSARVRPGFSIAYDKLVSILLISPQLQYVRVGTCVESMRSYQAALPY